MADSDFDAITHNGLMCDADGNIGSDEFCTIMETEIRQVMLQLPVACSTQI
jgi:hypothetical protein